MKKIAEMNASELSACLCQIAEPAEKLLSDSAVIEALDGFRKDIPEKSDVATAFSLFTTMVVPKLMDKKHQKDVYSILAAIDGVAVEEIHKRNGLETIRDMFVVFAMERDVETIFRPACEARSK